MRGSFRHTGHVVTVVHYVLSSAWKLKLETAAVVLSSSHFRCRSVSSAITSSLQCLKITPHNMYRTISPSYHHLWRSCCWPCHHRNCHWFLPGRCAGQRVTWHAIQVGSPGQRPPYTALRTWGFPLLSASTFPSLPSPRSLLIMLPVCFSKSVCITCWQVKESQ